MTLNLLFCCSELIELGARTKEQLKNKFISSWICQLRRSFNRFLAPVRDVNWLRVPNRWISLCSWEMCQWYGGEYLCLFMFYSSVRQAMNSRLCWRAVTWLRKPLPKCLFRIPPTLPLPTSTVGQTDYRYWYVSSCRIRFRSSSWKHCVEQLGRKDKNTKSMKFD